MIDEGSAFSLENFSNFLLQTQSQYKICYQNDFLGSCLRYGEMTWTSSRIKQRRIKALREKETSIKYNNLNKE